MKKLKHNLLFLLKYNEYMYLREFKILINKRNVLYNKLKISVTI
jgi:hypothetical protein